MVFMLWLAVGFDRYQAGSEQHIYIKHLAEGCRQILGDSPIQCHVTSVDITADKNISIVLNSWPLYLTCVNFSFNLDV